MASFMVLLHGFLIVCLQFPSWALAQTPIATSVFPSPSSNTTTRTSATQTNSAAFPSLTGYSACVTTCLGLGSAAANCTSLVDVNCYCLSNRFTSTIVDCISKGCPSELTTGESLAQKFCNVPSNSTSLSFPSPTILTSSSTSKSTSSLHTSSNNSATSIPSTTTTASPTKSNAALRGSFVGAKVGVSSIFYSIVIGILGSLLGAYLVE